MTTLAAESVGFPFQLSVVGVGLFVKVQCSWSNAELVQNGCSHASSCFRTGCAAALMYNDWGRCAV